MRDVSARCGRSAWVGCALGLMLFVTACDVAPVRFVEPLPKQLSQVGPVAWEAQLLERWPNAKPSSWIRRDESFSLIAPGGAVAAIAPDYTDADRVGGTLDLHEVGIWKLRAEFTLSLLGVAFRTSREVRFEVVDLDRPETCEILNAADCLLPYPSSRFLTRDATTETGWRLNLPADGTPPVEGGPGFPIAAINRHDGFSPGVHPLMHFPGGVDVAASGASRLLPPDESTTGPPFVRVRTHDERSRDADSPTLLIDADTGERILHWVETDARAEDPDRATLIVRPAVTLLPGHRYVVAVRHLVRPDGSPVEPEAPFRALRDRLPSTIPALEARRDDAERLFETLGAHGVERDDLLLAFDFVVRSERQLTRAMLSMRDQAFAWLDAQTEQTFTVTQVEDFTCSETEPLRRRVTGTFRSPLFLQDVPRLTNSVRLVFDPATGDPVRNGTMDARFILTIPCLLFEPGAPPIQTLVSGHGAFSSLPAYVNLNRLADAALRRFEGTTRWHYVTGGTEWLGWTPAESNWLGGRIIGLGASQLHNFEAWPHRTLQGHLNTLVLSRMMKRALFNADPAFQMDVDGDGDTEGVLPGPAADHYYWGISLGGTFGIMQAALSPDLAKAVVAEGQVNQAFQMQRWSSFPAFEALLVGIGLGDGSNQLLAIALVHELWAMADPVAYVRNVVRDRLPGSGDPVGVLAQVAWLDYQVSNHGSEMAYRTMGLPNLHGSVQRELVDIPDLDSGESADSALLIAATGLDILDPAQAPYIPPLANRIVEVAACDPHFDRWQTPASWQQITTFLAPGGRIENTCDGLCDAAIPFEIEFGNDAPCDPFAVAR